MTRRTSWVYALPPGPLVLQDGTSTVVTDSQLTDLARETRRYLLATAARAHRAGVTPYRLPVLSEHQRTGKRLGSLLDAKIADRQGKRGLWLLVSWTAAAWTSIEHEEIVHVSVGTEPTYTDETGTTYGPLVWELSITTHPRVKTLGSIQDTLRLRLSDKDKKMSPEEIAEIMAAQMQAIESLTARIAALEEAQATAQEMEAAEAAEDDKEEEEEIKAADDDKDKMALALADALAPFAASLKAQGEALKALTRTRGLHLAERGAGDTAPRGGTAQETLAEYKARTGTTGDAAHRGWLAGKRI